MVAGGVGLAPFAALAEALRARGVPCSLFYGARSGEELFYLDFFRTLGVDLVLTTEDGSVGERGRVVAPLERRLASRPAHQAVMVYACGPEGMMAATARAAERHGCPCEVSVERIMGCGLGGCYSCVVPMRERGRERGREKGRDEKRRDGEGHDGKGGFQHVRSCIAGPVLNGADILWD
jgi:dihydroorotate dehydrogenase electron transfer subunit